MLSALVKKLELIAYSSLPSLLIKVEGTTTPLISCPSTIFEVLPCGRETFWKLLESRQQTDALKLSYVN